MSSNAALLFMCQAVDLADTHAYAVVKDPVRLTALNGYGILDTPPEEGFDDIVLLASQICQTPVALVSLVTSDRQWFKARIGFPDCETDLNSSVCAHALVEPDLLVIDDLTADPRTAGNPLVTAAPFIRFYAGAPLRSPAGPVLGSLCVIDGQPRPGGLTEAQATNLRALARQVVGQLELRRAIAARDNLLQEQQAAITEIEALNATQAAVTGASGDIDRILDAVLTGAMQAVPAAEAGVIELIDGEMLEYRAVRGTITPHRGLRLPLHASLAGTCAVTATPLLVADSLKDERVKRDLVELLDLRAAVLAPVEHAGRVLGVLKLQSGKAGAFTLDDLRQARLFAGVATAGLTEVREMEGRQALAAADTHWHGLFEQLEEGFFIAEVVRDADGTVRDWRYVEVNRAWGELVGISVAEASGRSVRQLFPGIEDEWVDEFIQVVETGEAVSFTRQLGTLDRWYEGRAHKIGSNRFAVVFLEVTERMQADRRREALVELGDRLRETNDARHMANAAAEIIGRTLGATRAGYGTVNCASETIVIDADWQRPGVASLSGTYRFRDFGSFIEDLKRGDTVAFEDVDTDPRTRAEAQAFAALSIRSLINVPLVEQDQLVAVMFVHQDKPRVWHEKNFDFVRSMADRTQAAIARVRAEAEQKILNQELSHRMKNTMAIIQAVAKQTLKSVPDRAPVDALMHRLHSLSAAHDVLLHEHWSAAGLDAVAAAVLGSVGLSDRIRRDGPPFMLGPRATLSLSLLLHEMATNALKYGALSVDAGHVELRWRVDTAGTPPELVLEWHEFGGPPALEPSRKGFGSRLINMGLVGTGGVTLDYAHAGLFAAFRAPLDQVQHS